MLLNRLLKLQLLYCTLGILFNIVSILVIHNGGQQLTPNVPVTGMIVMSTYGLFLLSGYFKKITLYRILMLLSVLLLGYGGVFNHFGAMSQTPELYYSIPIGILGMSINIFGLILNIIAALGRFKVA